MKWKCTKPITLKKPVPEVTHNALFHVLCTNTKYEIQKNYHTQAYIQICTNTCTYNSTFMQKGEKKMETKTPMKKQER